MANTRTSKPRTAAKAAKAAAESAIRPVGIFDNPPRGDLRQSAPRGSSTIRQADLAVVRVSRGERGGLDVSAAATGYDVASGDRSFRKHAIRFEGADRGLDYSSRRKLVSIARDLDRNSLLSAMIDRWVDGTVGSNVNFRPFTGDEGWNKAAHEQVKERMKSCDHRGFFDAAALTRIMLRAVGTDGEELWAMTADDKIQVVETHQIGTPRDKMGLSRKVVDGVELADDGRPAGYWVSDEVYGGFIAKSGHAEFVPAANSIFPAYRKRASQTHGVPMVAAGMKLYDRVDGYIDNEALAAEIDACLTFFIRRKSDVAKGPWIPTTGKSVETAASGTAKVLSQVEPGMIARLDADEEVDQFGAKRPGNQFTPFVEMGLTLVGATIGVPLPMALLDFKKLNYSNARTMLLQMWQTWQIWHRSTVVPCWQWVYERWVVKEIAKSPTLRARDDAFKVKWLPRRWPWVDPLKEIQALREEIALGTATISDQLELCDYTLEEYLAERSHELKRFAAMGVPTTSIAGQPVKYVMEDGQKNGGWDTSDEDEDEDEDDPASPAGYAAARGPASPAGYAAAREMIL